MNKGTDFDKINTKQFLQHEQALYNVKSSTKVLITKVLSSNNEVLK